MTREMNKPIWAVDCKECMNFGCEFKKERTLNEDIAEFFYATNERFK